jgi:hypothetical protein
MQGRRLPSLKKEFKLEHETDIIHPVLSTNVLHNLGLRLPLNPLLLLRRRKPLLGIKVARVGILPTARLRTVVLNPTPYPSLLGLLKSNLLRHHLKLINALIVPIPKIHPILTSKLDASPNLLLMSPITTGLVRRLSCTAVWVKEHRTSRAGTQSNLHLAPITIPAPRQPADYHPRSHSRDSHGPRYPHDTQQGPPPQDRLPPIRVQERRMSIEQPVHGHPPPPSHGQQPGRLSPVTPAFPQANGHSQHIAQSTHRPSTHQGGPPPLTNQYPERAGSHSSSASRHESRERHQQLRWEEPRRLPADSPQVEISPVRFAGDKPRMRVGTGEDGAYNLAIGGPMPSAPWDAKDGERELQWSAWRGCGFGYQ